MGEVENVSASTPPSKSSDKEESKAVKVTEEREGAEGNETPEGSDDAGVVIRSESNAKDEKKGDGADEKKDETRDEHDDKNEIERDQSEVKKDDEMKDDVKNTDDSKVAEANGIINGGETDTKDEKEGGNGAKKEPIEDTTEAESEAKAKELQVELNRRRSGRERRERKSVESYVPEELSTAKEKVIPKGKGTKLEQMPNVVSNFSNITWSDPHLKSLHGLALGQGKKKEFKANLLQFSGLVYPEGKDVELEQDKMKSKMYKLQMDELKAVMDLCDIDRSSESFGKKTPNKEQLCVRLLEWLEEPKVSDKKVKSTPKKSPASKKRKDSPAAKGSAKKSPNKKVKKESPKPKKSPKVATPSKSAPKKSNKIDFNIPGANIDQVREKVKNIVNNANREELTVKGVRKLLEEWLDTDLSEHKDAVRSLVMEVM